MSRATKRVTFGLGVALFTLIGIIFIGANAGAREEAHEKPGIIVVARDLAFRLEDSSGITSPGEGNPTLTLAAGETVNIQFRNEDPGFIHSLVVEGNEVRKTRSLPFGESEVISLTVPESGTLEYFCSHHAEMMRGRILVSGSPSLTRRTQ